MPTIIETKPNILGGMPVLKGTRIPIARVVALFVQGYKVKDFKRDYPYLTITKKDKLLHAVHSLGLSRQAEDSHIYQKAIEANCFVLTVNFRDFKKFIRQG